MVQLRYSVEHFQNEHVVEQCNVIGTIGWENVPFSENKFRSTIIHICTATASG